jgi:RNA-directed DNA polymerase
VILVDSQPRQQWLRQAVEKRLREELAKLQVEVNDEKSRKVDLVLLCYKMPMLNHLTG